MSAAPAPASDIVDPHDPAANRGIAALRLALLPIALIELPKRTADLAVDVYPIIVGVLGVYAAAILALSVRRPARTPPPLVQALIDLALISALVYTSGGAGSPLRFAFYVLPIIAALRLSPQITAVWTALALGAYLLVTVPHPTGREAPDATIVLEEALTLIWVGAAAVMLSALVGRRAAAFAALAASRQELVQQALDAEARERRRLAQVLHDDAIQNLLVARQEVTDAERGVPGAGARAKQAIDASHRQLRDEVFAMHPVGLERAGPAAVLTHFGEDAGRRGHFTAHVHVDPAATQAGSDLLYASAREILRNTAKHARASTVDISLRVQDGSQVLTIADDGVGFGPERLEQALASGHIGLASVAERLHAVGGELQIDSRAGRGTTITVVVPADRSGR